MIILIQSLSIPFSCDNLPKVLNHKLKVFWCHMHFPKTQLWLYHSLAPKPGQKDWTPLCGIVGHPSYSFPPLCASEMRMKLEVEHHLCHLISVENENWCFSLCVHCPCCLGFHPISLCLLLILKSHLLHEASQLRPPLWCHCTLHLCHSTQGILPGRKSVGIGNLIILLLGHI